MSEVLFVYGTLAPGRPNESVLAELEGSWRAGYVHGQLIEQGWGSDYGYPAIKLHPEGDKVDGFIFTSADLTEFWPKLDEFEGAEYERVVTSVTLEDGSQVDAFIYQAVES